MEVISILCSPIVFVFFVLTYHLESMKINEKRENEEKFHVFIFLEYFINQYFIFFNVWYIFSLIISI